MKLIKWAALAAVLVLAAACMVGCAKENDVARRIAEELKKQWQTVDWKTPTKEECEEAFVGLTLGGQEITLPDAEQYDLITCNNPESEDGKLTILISGGEMPLSEFVQGMGFLGYNVEYQKNAESENSSVYQWKAEKNSKTCVITVTAAPGPLEIQVEILHT